MIWPTKKASNKVDSVWKVSCVLDWEFSFSGSVLSDVANMLRYAHKMPHEFQDAFLSGLASGGVTLPKNWRITIQLFNYSKQIRRPRAHDVKGKTR